MEQTYFRKGFGLRAEIRGLVDGEYHSALVERIRARGYSDQLGPVQVRLAEEFGFCYGVDRAVDYAYETRLKFPEKKIYLVGEIIHNPHVNNRMQEMGIVFLYPEDGVFDFSGLTTDDVVLLPAFWRDHHRLRSAEADRLCAGGHHLWFSTARLEAGGGLRAGRLYRFDSWQVHARRIAGDRVAGGAVRRRHLPHRA